MSNPWPERRSIPYGFGHKDYEDDAEYAVFLLQQLFVEIAQVKAMLEKPLYQVNAPPLETLNRVSPGCLNRFGRPGWFTDSGDVNDHDAKRPSNSSLKDTP